MFRLPSQWERKAKDFAAFMHYVYCLALTHSIDLIKRGKTISHHPALMDPELIVGFKHLNASAIQFDEHKAAGKYEPAVMFRDIFSTAAEHRVGSRGDHCLCVEGVQKAPAALHMGIRSTVLEIIDVEESQEEQNEPRFNFYP